ncbi:MAG: class I SAM-dependent methyltransferase [Elusimicrobia bacterium]|nr:class I SAM-dependent methyltransferase [Elusimicrobiota bacterium]
MSAPACYLCRGQEHETLGAEVFQAPGSKVYKCRGCELVFLHPIMTPGEEKAFYQADWDKYMAGRSGPGWKSPESHFVSYQPEGERRLALVRPYLKADDSALEIGSATGYFLDDLRGYVREVTGVEPNPLQREHAVSRGLKTVSDVAELGERTFDVIFGYYVFEHFRDPVQTAKDLKKRLKPGGRLVLEVPNVDDVLLGPYRIPAFAPFYWQKAHYFNYSQKTFAAVLERAGLTCEVLPVQRYDLSNHMVWMMEQKPGGAGRFKELFTPALEAAYADALKARWRCDTVMAVARAA